MRSLLEGTLLNRKAERKNYLFLAYELHFTSELVPGNVNWGEIVQFSSQGLTRR